MDSREGEVDYISPLPDDILHQILSPLWTKDAVRSSILSKRWRHLWKYLPTLRFVAFTDTELSFISRSMDLHREPKLTSLYVYGDIGKDSVPPVDKWVEFAALKCVKDLTLLITPLGDEEFELPSSLFNSDSIEALHLSHFQFYPPLEGFSGLRSLKNLQLVFCEINDEVVYTLLSTCQLLENLEVYLCSGLYEFIIRTSTMNLKNVDLTRNRMVDDDDWLELVLDVPNLECFRYSGMLVPTCLNCFKGHARVISISEGSISNAVKMSEELSHVTVLTVDCWFTWLLLEGYYEISARAMPYKNLEEFCWLGPLRSKTEIKLLVAFLGDCPSLRKIKLNFLGYTKAFLEEEAEDRPEIHISNLSQLRAIDVSYYAGHKCEMELLQILLKKAVKLEKLLVTVVDPQSGYMPVGADIKILQEQVSLLHRASVHSQLLLGTRIVPRIHD